MIDTFLKESLLLLPVSSKGEFSESDLETFINTHRVITNLTFKGFSDKEKAKLEQEPARLLVVFSSYVELACLTGNPSQQLQIALSGTRLVTPAEILDVQTFKSIIKSAVGISGKTYFSSVRELRTFLADKGLSGPLAIHKVPAKPWRFEVVAGNGVPVLINTMQDAEELVIRNKLIKERN